VGDDFFPGVFLAVGFPVAGLFSAAELFLEVALLEVAFFFFSALADADVEFAVVSASF
jgi:hypothetical protein